MPDAADRLRLLELSVLVGMADGVESADELDRLRKLTELLEIPRDDIPGVLERARERFFDLTRVWENEDPES